MSVISIVRNDFKEYYIWLCNTFFYWRHSLKMSLAIRLADLKQKAYNRQYHVMLLELPKKINGKVCYDNKLVSVCRSDIERFKRKRWIPKQIGMIELKQTSFFYSTPLNRNNKTTAEERKEAKKKYIRYAKKYLKD